MSKNDRPACECGARKSGNRPKAGWGSTWTCKRHPGCVDGAEPAARQQMEQLGVSHGRTIDDEPEAGDAEFPPEPKMSLASFVRGLAWPALYGDDPPRWTRAHDELCEHLEQLVVPREGIVRHRAPLSWDMTIGSTAFPAWLWMYEPHMRIAVVSSGSPMHAIQRILQKAGVPHTCVRDQHDGPRLVTAAGGSISFGDWGRMPLTGDHFDVLVLDRPADGDMLEEWFGVKAPRVAYIATRGPDGARVDHSTTSYSDSIDSLEADVAPQPKRTVRIGVAPPLDPVETLVEQLSADLVEARLPASRRTVQGVLATREAGAALGRAQLAEARARANLRKLGVQL